MMQLMVLRRQRARSTTDGNLGFGRTGRSHCGRTEHLSTGFERLG